MCTIDIFAPSTEQFRPAEGRTGMQACAQRRHFASESGRLPLIYLSLIYFSIACALTFAFARTAGAAENEDVDGARLAAAATLPERRAANPFISLAEVEEEVRGIARVSSFILFQGDGVVLEYFAKGSARNKPINIKSASKSILNALVAIALQRGDLENLDAPIATYLPEYFKRIPENDSRREITIRHLLMLSSGLPSTSIYNYGAWVSSKDWTAYSLNQEPIARPGTRFIYSTGDTHLLAAVLTRATGMSLRAYAQRHLFDSLGVEIGGWDRDPQGVYFGGNNLALAPEALLRFGRLYLNGGVYEGTRVMSAEWIAQSWTPRFFNSSFNGRHDYGYLWWHARFGGHSTWFAWGYGGQFLFVIPSLEAVVVLTGDPDARSRGGNEAIYRLIDRTIVPYLTQAVTDKEAE
jgi:CubicO group peptidase (beta-lactamase class C family)